MLALEVRIDSSLCTSQIASPKSEALVIILGISDTCLGAFH